MWCYAYLTNGTIAWPIQEKGLATAYTERRYVWEPPWQIVNDRLREKYWRRGLFGEYRKRHLVCR